MTGQITKRSGSANCGQAFTLIELMIVIAIMAVVMSLSIPTFYRSLEKDTIRRATQNILDLCADARAQAIISGRPCDLMIRPAERTFVPQLAQEQNKTEEELLLEEAEKIIGDNTGAKEGAAEVENKNALPDDIVIMFIGVNFVPDLQTSEEVPVRFYPNGTGDEFTLLIRSDRNEWRKFTMEVATGIVNWEVVR
jgi:prepilin-type N-terminal cleavage/methylation domain-containing protein